MSGSDESLLLVRSLRHPGLKRRICRIARFRNLANTNLAPQIGEFCGVSPGTRRPRAQRPTPCGNGRIQSDVSVGVDAAAQRGPHNAYQEGRVGQQKAEGDARERNAAAGYGR